MTYKETLEKIATVNAMDYEYQAWAREALAKQEQSEPELVTAAQKVIEELGTSTDGLQELYQSLKLYTTPQQRKPLTDEQLMEFWIDAGWPDAFVQFKKTIRKVEAAHGIKE